MNVVLIVIGTALTFFGFTSLLTRTHHTRARHRMADGIKLSLILTEGIGVDAEHDDERIKLAHWIALDLRNTGLSAREWLETKGDTVRKVLESGGPAPWR